MTDWEGQGEGRVALEVETERGEAAVGGPKDGTWRLIGFERGE